MSEHRSPAERNCTEEQRGRLTGPPSPASWHTPSDSATSIAASLRSTPLLRWFDASLRRFQGRGGGFYLLKSETWLTHFTGSRNLPGKSFLAPWLREVIPICSAQQRSLGSTHRSASCVCKYRKSTGAAKHHALLSKRHTSTFLHLYKINIFIIHNYNAWYLFGEKILTNGRQLVKMAKNNPLSGCNGMTHLKEYPLYYLSYLQSFGHISLL